MEKEERIQIAIRCRDSDGIPKIKEAGRIINDHGGRTFQLMHNGVKVFTDSHYGEFNVRIIEQLKGVHEPQEEKVFYEVLKAIPEHATMLELGSFWAYYSMWFKSRVPHGRNYLVEPMRDMMEKGVDNFRLNNMQGDFTQAFVGRFTSNKAPFKDWDGTYYERFQIHIDGFLDEKQISFLNILHADIQGAELDMLKGAEKSLSGRRIGFIFISTHSEPLHFNCLELLKSHGYRIIAEHTLAESFSTDGLIVAVNPDISFPRIKVSKRFSMESIKIRISNFL